MTAGDREKELESFRYKPTKTVFLVSLRAGAYGLNLTCASQCVLLDPFWNPFVEEQAIDRIHRIGQSRHVKVYRIVIEGTVEDRILKLQAKVFPIESNMVDFRNGVLSTVLWQKMHLKPFLDCPGGICCTYSELATNPRRDLVSFIVVLCVERLCISMHS